MRSWRAHGSRRASSTRCAVHGSLHAVNDAIVTRGDGVPEDGYVYPLVHEGRTIDESLSGRGLVRLWRHEVEKRVVSGEPASARELRHSAIRVARLAEAGDRAALDALRRFGDLLAAALAEVYAAFAPEVVVLGGQVSRSLPYFAAAAAEAGAPPLTLAAAPDLAALRGAAVHFFESGAVA